MQTNENDCPIIHLDLPCGAVVDIEGPNERQLTYYSQGQALVAVDVIVDQAGGLAGYLRPSYLSNPNTDDGYRMLRQLSMLIRLSGLAPLRNALNELITHYKLEEQEPIA